jgi:hypothetical protein
LNQASDISVRSVTARLNFHNTVLQLHTRTHYNVRVSFTYFIWKPTSLKCLNSVFLHIVLSIHLRENSLEEMLYVSVKSSSSSSNIRPSGLLRFHSIFLTVFLGFFSHVVCSSKGCLIHSFNMFLPIGPIILDKFKNWFDFQIFLNFFISFVVPKYKTSSFPHEFHMIYIIHYLHEAYLFKENH